MVQVQVLEFGQAWAVAGYPGQAIADGLAQIASQWVEVRLVAEDLGDNRGNSGAAEWEVPAPGVGEDRAQGEDVALGCQGLAVDSDMNPPGPLVPGHATRQPRCPNPAPWP